MEQEDKLPNPGVLTLGLPRAVAGSARLPAEFGYVLAVTRLLQDL